MEDYSPADVLAQGKGSSDSSNENYTAYARDRFTIGDHWTFNAGLRFSMQENLNDVRNKVVDTETFEPRLAVSYDITGDSTKLDHPQRRPLLRPAQPAVHQPVADGGVERLERVRRLPLLRRRRRQRDGLCGSLGYNFLLRSFRPGEQFDLAEQGIIPEIDLDPYYKDELIVGFEWQVSNNWAFDAKGIYWELGDIIMNTTQRWNSNPGAGYDAAGRLRAQRQRQELQEGHEAARPGR